MRYASLANANLQGANLSGAAWRQANLQGANFTQANLIQSPFDGANLKNATVGGIILVDQEFLDGTSPRIYPWNQSKIENPQAPAFIRGVNLKSKI
ncbi:MULTISPECIES: pentapeptide repeat-containing protein [unclassified Microcoleus]|uniref:pentapeptide repeat-containing protein n=1 Tax=unclassified Microcoleus TaxID=2642155 RepID=UPI002FD41A07